MKLAIGIETCNERIDYELETVLGVFRSDQELAKIAVAADGSFYLPTPYRSTYGEASGVNVDLCKQKRCTDDNAICDTDQVK
jgi:hypothetical protein